MALTDITKDFLTQAVSTVTTEVPDVLGMAISRNVSITAGEPVAADPQVITRALSGPLVQIQFTVTAQPEDLVQIYFSSGFGLRIAQWMTGDEDGQTLEEQHLDALREAANMILGSLSTSFSDQLGRSVEFYSIRAEVMDDPSLLDFDFPDPVQVEFKIMIEGDKDQSAYLVAASETVTHFQNGASEGGAEDMHDMDMDDTDVRDTGEDDAMMSEESSDMEEMDGGAGRMPSRQVMEDEGVDLDIPGVEGNKVELLLDLSLPITIELGRTRMLIKDILELGHGSVVEFDKLAGDPVDLLINDKKIAEGEVVVIDEHFGIRLTSLVRPSDRIKNLGK